MTLASPLPSLIGLHGPKGVGKTTIAKYIQSNAQEKYVIKSFAGPLKSTILALGLGGVNSNHLACPILKAGKLPEPVMLDEKLANYILDQFRIKKKIKNWKPRLVTTPRMLLQTVGTEIVRATEPNYWLNCMQISIFQYESLIVDDVRFPDEAALIRKYEGMIVHVEREEILYEQEHTSEYPLPRLSGDFLLTNKTPIGSSVLTAL